MADQRPTLNIGLPQASLELPDPGAQERERIRRSIARQGVLEPITVSAGPALPGAVADGRLRDQLTRELNVDCPRRERGFASELDFHLYRYTVNVDRRQLTQVQRIRLGLQLEPFEAAQAARRKAQAQGGKRGQKSLPVALPEQTGETRQRVARAVGLKPSSYERGAKVLKEGSLQLVADFEASRETINSAYQRLRGEQRRQAKLQLAQQLSDSPPQLLRGRHHVLVIDPPWPHDSLPYPTMSLEEIAVLPITELLAEDAIVWLWTTNRFHYDAERIARQHWQLTYRNTLTWAKTDQRGNPRPGTGHWLRGETEHCLLYSRGNPLFVNGNHTTLLQAPAREHSRKPDAFYTLVEQTSPGSKLELFARQHRPGWASWGSEITKFDATDSEQAA